MCISSKYDISSEPLNHAQFDIDTHHS